MISVQEALDAVLALASPMPEETVALREAPGRVLARPVTAPRDQPPFPASAMDGYAVQNADVAPGARLSVIGRSAAGHSFGGTVAQGQAVRIFTGAPVPKGADRVVIQEDVTVAGDEITLGEDLDAGPYIRPQGTDFQAGFTLEPQRLGPPQIALLAAMNQGEVAVRRRPVVAIIPTGDELIQPGESPGADQIVASNTYGLAAALEAEGAKVRLLPIAKDTVESLAQGFALSGGADIVITIGGASVGDHDIVASAAQDLGLERTFYKVAMRPGKPLMAGRIRSATMVGLPGNPVSAMVCGVVFIQPLIRAVLGLAPETPLTDAPLAHALGASGPRAHYMRARLENGALTVFDRQDSALLHVLAAANALAIRPPGDPAREAGERLKVIRI